MEGHPDQPFRNLSGHAGLDHHLAPPGFYGNHFSIINAFCLGIGRGDIGCFFTEQIIDALRTVPSAFSYDNGTDDVLWKAPSDILCRELPQAVSSQWL